MNASQRAALSRRLAAAEDLVARRAMARVAELITVELTEMPVDRAHLIMFAIRRASQSGAGSTDAVAVLLREIAAVEPEIAGRIGKAVGVEVPAPVPVSAQD